MKKTFISIASILMLLLYGCVSPQPNMKLSAPVHESASPTANKALVYFLRPKAIGFAVSAAVYDGDKFIGFVPYGQKLSYLAEPGEHMFMVVSEAADFMKAELVAGKTYYAQVVPRMGAWRARFSLWPVRKDQLNSAQVKEWIETAGLIKNKPEAYQWAKNNESSVMQKKEAYFAKWKTKTPDQQPFLQADDGV